MNLWGFPFPGSCLLFTLQDTIACYQIFAEHAAGRLASRHLDCGNRKKTLSCDGRGFECQMRGHHVKIGPES